MVIVGGRQFKPTEYLLGDPHGETPSLRIVKCYGYRLPTEPMWKVMDGSCVLSVNGQWEHEPIPSSRDDEFYQRCRFRTFEEAALMAIATNQVPIRAEDETIELEREEDGRWIAESLTHPGALAYGATPQDAKRSVLALIEDRPPWNGD